MAEATTKPKPVVRSSANHQRGTAAPRFAELLDRTSELSDELVKSLESAERAAVGAIGQFVIVLEEALPQEVAGTSEVAKKITESGLEMTDRLIHTQHELLHKVIESSAKSVGRRGGAKLQAAH